MAMTLSLCCSVMGWMDEFQMPVRSVAGIQDLNAFYLYLFIYFLLQSPCFMLFAFLDGTLNPLDAMQIKLPCLNNWTNKRCWLLKVRHFNRIEGTFCTSVTFSLNKPPCSGSWRLRLSSDGRQVKLLLTGYQPITGSLRDLWDYRALQMMHEKDCIGQTSFYGFVLEKSHRLSLNI